MYECVFRIVGGREVWVGCGCVGIMHKLYYWGSASDLERAATASSEAARLK